MDQWMIVITVSPGVFLSSWMRGSNETFPLILSCHNVVGVAWGVVGVWGVDWAGVKEWWGCVDKILQNRWMDEWTDGWMNEQMDGWTNGWMDRWIDRTIYE